jgi:hypothetical protein
MVIYDNETYVGDGTSQGQNWLKTNPALLLSFYLMLTNLVSSVSIYCTDYLISLLSMSPSSPRQTKEKE